MWLVPKQTNGKNARVELPEPLKEGLIRWYLGHGSEADHRASVSMVVTARENDKWIACDCRGGDAAPPLMSPAYLSEQETYYLRRLTSRPLHQRKCPFYRPQAPDRIRRKADDSLFEIEYPKGHFNAHKEAPEKLAQMPVEDEPDDRTRDVAIPRLGKLLWMLLEAAHANVIGGLPREGRPDFDIRKEFLRIKRAAELFEIAPGIKLSDHLYTKAIDYESKRLHAILRKSAPKWPAGYAPQAFLLLEANEIGGTTVSTGLGDVEIRNRIQHTGIIRAEVDPPFLALAVVGEHSKKEGFLALRAYAQPIYKGNQFIPVERHLDRQLLSDLTRFQYRMRQKGVEIAIKKPLFDILTEKGHVRPEIIVAFLDHRTGEEADFALQIMRRNDTSYLELKAEERLQLEGITKVITVDHSLVGTDGILDVMEAHID